MKVYTEVRDKNGEVVVKTIDGMPVSHGMFTSYLSKALKMGVANKVYMNLDKETDGYTAFGFCVQVWNIEWPDKTDESGGEELNALDACRATYEQMMDLLCIEDPNGVCNDIWAGSDMPDMTRMVYWETRGEGVAKLKGAGMLFWETEEGDEVNVMSFVEFKKRLIKTVGYGE